MSVVNSNILDSIIANNQYVLSQTTKQSPKFINLIDDTTLYLSSSDSGNTYECSTLVSDKHVVLPQASSSIGCKYIFKSSNIVRHYLFIQANSYTDYIYGNVIQGTTQHNSDGPLHLINLVAGNSQAGDIITLYCSNSYTWILTGSLMNDDSLNFVGAPPP